MQARSNNSIGAYEAKTHFSAILEKVASGQEITITRRGMPIARLVPVEREGNQADRRAAIERILARREQLSLRGLAIRDLIQEGRR